MICALTVRKLKPGTFDRFHEAFVAPMREGQAPRGLVRFNMVRSTEDPDLVVTFGVFDGTPEQLREWAAEFGYAEQQAAIAPFVESVGADGFFDIIEERVAG